MTIRDVMRTDVWRVTPDTPLKEVASILVTANVSGLPVCDSDGHVLGVVSERDIIVKEQPRTGPHGRIARMLLPDDEDELKAGAHTAGEAMTGPALTIGPRRHVTGAARVFVENEIERLPVVDDAGRRVGMVTRTKPCAALRAPRRRRRRADPRRGAAQRDVAGSAPPSRSPSATERCGSTARSTTLATPSCCGRVTRVCGVVAVDSRLSVRTSQGR